MRDGVIGHNAFATVVAKACRHASPVFSAEKTWLRPSITHAPQADAGLIPHMQKPAKAGSHVRDGVIETPTTDWEALILPLN